MCKIIALLLHRTVYTGAVNVVQQPGFYPPAEERINIVSHVLGLLFSTVGVVFLLVKAAALDSAVHIVSAAVFGFSLVALYTASSIYHSTTDSTRRKALRTLDHAAIYVLIAGTYTPFTLIILEGPLGWAMFGLAWGLALTGITLKLFFTGRFERLSTSMYVFMGWMMVFAIKPLLANFAPEGMAWLIAGGICYTVGALLYSIKKLPFGHAAFHILVLLGSACHFVAVYFFVLAPSNS
ncbi:MAG: hemolysin III family protein [Proteobacteria bacterium]|nr:hemolysin III family protein [Pseudomonadota bacterium]